MGLGWTGERSRSDARLSLSSCDRISSHELALGHCGAINHYSCVAFYELLFSVAIKTFDEPAMDTHTHTHTHYFQYHTTSIHTGPFLLPSSPAQPYTIQNGRHGGSSTRHRVPTSLRTRLTHRWCVLHPHPTDLGCAEVSQHGPREAPKPTGP